MCGISGIIEFNQESYHVPAIKHMVSSMHRRGPDDEGFVLFNSNPRSLFRKNNNYSTYEIESLPYIPKEHIDTFQNRTSSIALGFTRLSIIDLSHNGHQPMCDKTEQFWIIFNGELYNYRELKKELSNLGYNFYSDSDTEVVLKSYIQWGDKALHKFNGMFAFCIIDRYQNEAFLARDRMGIKPLYYFKDSNRFVFGSTIKSIIDSKLYEPNINYEGLRQNFTFSIAQRPNTCFQEVFAIEPAHFMKINLTSGYTQNISYWNIPVGTQDFSLTESKAQKLLEETLFNSIKYRLQADVTVGTFMSGGIDSSLISAIASKINPSIKAFTLGYDRQFKEYDEVSEAQATAKLNSLNHIIHTANVDDFVGNITNIVINYEEPYHHLPANYLISKVVKEHNVKVILNGLGGDELFAGYHYYTKTKKWHLLQSIEPFLKSLPNISQRIEVAKKIASYKEIAEYYTHFNSTFRNNENNRLFKKDLPFDSFTVIENLYKPHQNFSDDIEALSYYNLKSYISNHQTRSVDQFTMYFSIEGRFPFLDHHLIELAFKIPSKFKIKNSSQKYILRKIAKKYIAQESLKMKKKGFSLPLNYWYKNELYDFTRDTINTLKNRNFFQNQEIDQIVKSNNASKIWQLVTTEIWLQEFFGAGKKI